MAPLGDARRVHDSSLGLAYVAQAGCHSLLKLLGEYGPEAVWLASGRRLLGWGAAPRAVQVFEEKRRGFRADEAGALLARAGMWFVPFGSRLYPKELAHLQLPPAGMFVRGREEVLQRVVCSARATIVGTRKATAYGLHVTEAFGRAFAAEGIVVVSGMALGVDSCAHKAAIAEGGLTAAVLGCGADIVYPPRNRWLYDQMIESGVVLSELPPGTPPARWTFPYRNRLLAALGDAVLVTEGSPTSGALQTAGWALELGRPVFSVPGSIYLDGHRGCNLLLYEGASPAVEPCVTVQDFLLQTRIERGERQSSVGGRQGAPGGQERVDVLGHLGCHRGSVLAALEGGPSSLDGLAQRTGLTVRDLSVALVELELARQVTRVGPGTYIRAP